MLKKKKNLKSLLIGHVLKLKFYLMKHEEKRKLFIILAFPFVPNLGW